MFLPPGPIRAEARAARAAYPQEPAGSPCLKLTTSQLDSIRSDFESGIRARTCRETRARAAALCGLADFPEGALVGDGDLVAGVAARFEGPFAGTAIWAMEPEDALAWVKAAGDGGDPIAGYVALAGGGLSAALSGWGRSMDRDFVLGVTALREDGLAGILLATHAPSDTLILSIRIDLEVGGRALPAHVYVLIDPKLLGVWAAQHAARGPA